MGRWLFHIFASLSLVLLILICITYFTLLGIQFDNQTHSIVLIGCEGRLEFWDATYSNETRKPDWVAGPPQEVWESGLRFFGPNDLFVKPPGAANRRHFSWAGFECFERDEKVMFGKIIGAEYTWLHGPSWPFAVLLALPPISWLVVQRKIRRANQQTKTN